MISIIIPTLNEEKHIARCVADVQSKAKEAFEIIIVDAGSEDATISIIQELDDVILVADQSLKGKKYASLNKGAEIAKGDILLFLDADTILPAGFQQLIQKILNPSDVVGGAFEMVFDQHTAFLQFIRVVNSLRYNISKRCYGDQAIFCKKESFHKVGGYPKKIVLEAAHFCRRLMNVGRFRIIKRPVITSSRRFLEGGVIKTFLFDLYLLSLDNLGLNIEKSARKYWEKNA
ncbi:MAG: rSAM/selenodomain-associated transferase 2 [Cyclobacteriaceae bacterium]